MALIDRKNEKNDGNENKQAELVNDQPVYTTRLVRSRYSRSMLYIYISAV